MVKLLIKGGVDKEKANKVVNDYRVHIIFFMIYFKFFLRIFGCNDIFKVYNTTPCLFFFFLIIFSCIEKVMERTSELSIWIGI